MDERILILLAVLVVALVLVFSTGRRAAPFAGRTCRDCGAGHPPFARFCRRCGKRL
jgi:hypothetical protein